VVTQFFRWIEQLSGHEAIVAGVGLAFFALQVLFSFRVCARANSQQRLLKYLHQTRARGSDGRCEVHEAPRGFGWLRWVLAEFPRSVGDESGAPARFTRDEAFEELDVRIGADPAYLMLQRMSVMAPLLGVVLTVLGFLWLDVNQADEQSLQTILTAVTPLVTGVGAGAVLALINQFLLQLAGGRLERLRMTARSWFDSAIWPSVGRQVQVAAEGAMIDHARIARSFAVVAAQCERTVALFQADMQGIPQALCGARDALEASARLLADLAPAATRSVANLDVSVAAFRTTIDREFSEAARLHYRASKLLAGAVDDVSDAAQSLKSVAAQSLDAAGRMLPVAGEVPGADREELDAGEVFAADHAPRNGQRPR
jgi:hypothetical protein